MRPAFFLTVLFLGMFARADDLRPLVPDPYVGPELADLFDVLAFHVSFDGGAVPELAAGPRFEPRLSGTPDGRSKEPRFEPGLIGRALVLGSGRVSYPGKGNLPLESRGAVALWIRPHDWQRPNGENVTFVIAAGGRFYLQRQGPALKDGKRVRGETVQFLARTSADRHYTCLYGGVWENHRWYFLVANWSWPTLQLSVDGAEFSVRTWRDPPGTGLEPGGVHVGSDGSVRGLLDEMMFFRRPLTLDEVRRLYRVGLARAGR